MPPSGQMDLFPPACEEPASQSCSVSEGSLRIFRGTRGAVGGFLVTASTRKPDRSDEVGGTRANASDRTRGKAMIPANKRGRVGGSGPRVAGAMAIVGVAAMLAAGGPSGRALAFQATGGEDARPGSPAAKSKLTPRKPASLRRPSAQLQASVQADRKAGSANGRGPSSSDRLERSRHPRSPRRSRQARDPVPDQEQPQGRAGDQLTTDVEFVRRIYFDLIGKPPTPEQVHVVRARPLERQAARLIDTLLTATTMPTTGPKYWRDVVMFHATNENPGPGAVRRVRGMARRAAPGQ